MEVHICSELVDWYGLEERHEGIERKCGSVRMETNGRLGSTLSKQGEAMQSRVNIINRCYRGFNAAEVAQ
jgi:hypothetical protein